MRLIGLFDSMLSQSLRYQVTPSVKGLNKKEAELISRNPFAIRSLLQSWLALSQWLHPAGVAIPSLSGHSFNRLGIGKKVRLDGVIYDA